MKNLLKMRGNKKGFTLRKGIVKRESAPKFYILKDVLSGEEIKTSISGKLRIQDFSLNIGENAYVVVSIYDLTRGRLAIEGRRGGLEEFLNEKELLDNNKDPLEEKL